MSIDFFQYIVSYNPQKNYETKTQDSADISDLDIQRRNNMIERKFFSSSAILNFISESFDTNDDPNYSAKVCFNPINTCENKSCHVTLFLIFSQIPLIPLLMFLTSKLFSTYQILKGRLAKESRVIY